MKNQKTIRKATLVAGDTFRATLVAGEGGVQTKAKVNGLPCTILRCKGQTLVGDTWTLKLAGLVGLSMYEAELVELIAANDGRTEFWKQFVPGSLPEIRNAHTRVLEAYASCPADSPELCAAIYQVAKKWQLDGEYRYFLAVSALHIFNEHGCPEDDEPLRMALTKIAAHTAPEPEKLAFWKEVRVLQAQLGDTPEERASALGNAALQFHKDGEYRLASDLYRLALNLLPKQDYLSALLAECLAHLGEYEEAYRLVSGFPERYFSLAEGEFGHSRDEVLYERPSTV